jgi:type III secretion protein N (ATPase)
MSRPVITATLALQAQAARLTKTTAEWSNSRLAALVEQGSVEATGTVLEVVGTDIVCRVHGARLGMLCAIRGTGDDASTLYAEVVGFAQGRVRMSAMGSLQNVGPGDEVKIVASQHRLSVGPWLLGDVIDAFGRSMTGRKGAFHVTDSGPLGRQDDDTVSVAGQVRSPLERSPISEVFPTGVKAIDGLLTIGRGQRVGIFAGPGCGKTTLLGAIARGSTAQVVVFALIGERGREVQEFLQHTLDADTAQRTVVVAATSDRSSLERARAAFTATAIAEWFCAAGYEVLLMVDSLTRYARAQREIGIAAGEPPGRGGFPPSFYSSLPRLLERTGNFQQGSITAIYTVLSEQDLEADPVADESRSLLDGHVVLARSLAESGHFPAIDILASLSRTMPNVVSAEQMAQARVLRTHLARYKALEFLIRVGEYKEGRVSEDDLAVSNQPRIMDFLRQDIDAAPLSFQHVCESLHAVAAG